MVFDTNDLEKGLYGISDTKVLYRLSPRIDHPWLSKIVNLTTGEVHYPTNRDRLRHMTNEELAEWLAEHQKIGDAETHRDGYRQLWLDWLKQEVQEDE